jgi:hypothetical protein
MATVRTESLVDDLDGAADARTVTFAVDNFAYEIDLTEQHRSDLYDALETYMASGRQVHGERAKPKPSRNGRQPARTDPAQLAAVRAWAAQNGHAVKPRGRVPGRVVAAYEAAHQEATA